MKLEELENKDKLFNYELLKNDLRNEELNLTIHNTIDNNENSSIENLTEINSSSDNDNIYDNKNYLANEFESSTNQSSSEEFDINNLQLEEYENNNNSNSNDGGTVKIIVNEEESNNLSIDSDSSVEPNLNRMSNKKNENLLKLKNEQMTKSLQKMDSAIELEEKLNEGEFKLSGNSNDNKIEYDKNLNGSFISIKEDADQESLIKSENQKFLMGFNFNEQRKVINQSLSVPSSPIRVNNNQKLQRSKDDLSLMCKPLNSLNLQ